MAGLIIAAPIAPAAPLTAAGFAMGSVLPDLDVLSRCFGKLAFMRAHQTWTHSLIVAIIAGGIYWAMMGYLVVHELWAAPALAAGMILHDLVDMTNTYGAAILAPFSRKRISLEWVFFIDMPVLVVSLLAVVPAVWSLWSSSRPSVWISMLYAGFLFLYWLSRWAIRRRVRRLAPAGTQSLVPSAWVPWRFYGLAADESRIRQYSINALNGALIAFGENQVLDEQYRTLLENLPEYRLMRELSNGYCLTEASENDGEIHLVCRDLRTPNFRGTFGMLDAVFGPEGELRKKVFNV